LLTLPPTEADWFAATAASSEIELQSPRIKNQRTFKPRQPTTLSRFASRAHLLYLLSKPPETCYKNLDAVSLLTPQSFPFYIGVHATYCYEFGALSSIILIFVLILLNSPTSGALSIELSTQNSPYLGHNMVGIVSAAGLVGFLSEPDTELQVFALKTADKEISLLWTELAGAVGQMYVRNFLQRSS